MSAPNTAPIEFPSDPRVEHRYAVLNGIRYHYLLAEPKNAKPKVTVFLVCVGVFISPEVICIWAAKQNKSCHNQFKDGLLDFNPKKYAQKAIS
jgi:hypothetical protein